MLKKFYQRFIAVSLMLILLFNVSSNAIGATTNYFNNDDNEVVVINGYSFTIIEKDYNGVVLEYSDDDERLIATMNRWTSEITIEKININPLTRSMTSATFQVLIDEYLGGDNEIKGLQLVDTELDIVYDIDAMQNGNARLVYLVPVGIPVLLAFLEALLYVGLVIVEGAYLWSEAAEMYNELVTAKNENRLEYVYWKAKVDKTTSLLHIGDGMTTAEAKLWLGVVHNACLGLQGVLKPIEGVMSFNQAYARGLAGTNFDGPQIHGMTAGYWRHYHDSSLREAHIWFYE